MGTRQRAIDLAERTEKNLLQFLHRVEEYKKVVSKELTKKRPVGYARTIGKEYKSKDGTTYKYFLSTPSYNYMKRNGLDLTFYSMQTEDGGSYVCLLSGNFSKDRTAYVFIPHFFQRYGERHLKDSTPTDELVEIFLKKTSDIIYSKFPSSKYPNRILSVHEDGILLGNEYGTTVVFSTFVAKETLNKWQIIVREYGLKSTPIDQELQEKIEEFMVKDELDKKYFLDLL